MNELSGDVIIRVFPRLCLPIYGSGYPEGLTGEAIPLVGRLIRIVDYYDALTSYRSYRPKTIYSPSEALEVLRENRHCFDPSLLEAFVDLIDTRL